MIIKGTTTNSDKGSVRLDAIDGLRAIAALWVLGYHMWVRFLPGLIATHSDHGWWLWPLGWCRYGRFAVDFFIVISGFCLMLPVVSSGELRGGVASFWKKRARRILPTYYAAILATLPLCWLFVDWSRWFVTLKGLLLHAILLQDVFGNNEISSVYWSIAVECHIYLLFPLLVLLCRRVGPAWTFLLGSALGTALFWLLKGTPYVGSTPQYLILFSMGMLAANLCRRPGEGIKNALAVFFCAALLVLCGSGWVDRMQGVLGSTAPLALDSFVGLCAALVVLAAAQPAGLTARLLGGRPLVLIGGFSYSLYLIHAPIHFICFKTIWVLMQHRIPAEIAYPLFVLMTVPIVLAGALAFHLLFEAPFLSAGSGGELERLTGGLRAQSPLLAGVDRMLGRWMRPAHAPNPGPATQS